MNKLFVGLVVALVAAVFGVSAFIFKDGTARVADGVAADAGVVTAEGEGEGEAAPAVTPVTTPTSDTNGNDQSVVPTPTVEAGEPTVH